MLQYLLQENLVDYIAIDIKHIPTQYSEITNVNIATERYSKSIELIMTSQIDYEFRTTVIQ